MPVLRLAEVVAEVLVAPDGEAEASQRVAEVLMAMPTASPTTVTGAGVSQRVVEILLACDAHVEVSGRVVELLFSAAGPFEGGAESGGAQTLSYPIAV